MRARSLSLHQLEIFTTIAREGSFTKAAELLSLSEPAVSQQLRLLERTLGVRLLDRAPPKPIRLTEAGRRLLVTCENIFEQLSHGIEKLNALKRGEEGCVTFGVSPLFYSHLFPWLYGLFQHHIPGITVSAETNSRQLLVDALALGRLDLILVTDTVDNPRFENIRLAGIDVVLIGPPMHPLAGNNLYPFERLGSEQLILRPNAPVRGILLRKSAELGVALQFGWEAAEGEAQINAVRSGLGITALPFYAVKSMIAVGLLALLTVEGFPIRLNWSIVSLRGEMSAPAMAFRDHLMSQSAKLEEISLCPTE